MPREAFVLKIQRELCHPRCTRKVSGLSRNRPQVNNLTRAQPIEYPVRRYTEFICKRFLSQSFVVEFTIWNWNPCNSSFPSVNSNTLSRANEFDVSVRNLLLLIDRHFSSVRICFFFLLRREKRLKFSALIMSVSCLKITIGCCLVWLRDGLYITNNVGLVNSCADGKWWQFGGINKHLC